MGSGTTTRDKILYRLAKILECQQRITSYSKDIIDLSQGVSRTINKYLPMILNNSKEFENMYSEIFDEIKAE